ncbi:MAG: hypothetical protein IIA03_04750 [Proteobacteria bacterium]|nr:hypothetical protein [Pseudomonadota bacterium]
MLRRSLAILAAGAALLAASAAQAGPRWSISINVPLPGVVVSEGRYEHRWDERRDDDGPWRRR